MKTLKDLVHCRLQQQHLNTPLVTDPEGLVHYMGALQAQDAAMVKWAVGVRLPDCTLADIDAALDKGTILRTHVLRPTWHLVAAQDIHWMLALSAPQIHALLRTWHRKLEITGPLLHKALKIITRALEGGRHQTREQLVARLSDALIPTDEHRSALILMYAELDALICSGRQEGNKTTYALLEERVPKRKVPDRETALAQLADYYFTSHGPATLADFCWWSGLPVKDAKAAIAMQGKNLDQVTINDTTYLFKGALVQPAKLEQQFLLLPAFDEFLISYKDRSAALTEAHRSLVITRNGIFNPVIVLNGQVTGLWKRNIKKDMLSIHTDGLPELNKIQQRLLQRAAEHLGRFTGKEIILQ